MDMTKSPADLEYRRRLIEELVVAYCQRYPEQLRQCKKSVKKMRGTRANAYAADNMASSVPMRWAFRLPGGLVRVFEKLIHSPPILQDEAEFKWFMKRFPQFRIPQKS